MSERPRPTLAQLQRYAEQFNQSQTLKHFGVRVAFPDTETVEAVLDPIRPEQRGGLGTDAVNGGVLAAMFDLAIGVTPALIDPTRKTATVQLSMHFMRALKGSKLIARARLERVGGMLAFSTATLFDDQGNACAICSGMARLSEEKWASGESPAIN